MTQSHATRASFVNALSRVFRWAVDHGKIEVRPNPFADIKHKRRGEEPNHYDFMTDEALGKILALLPEEDHFPAIIARHSGMRLGDIFNLDPKLHVAMFEGVWCFDIQKGKTEAAKRKMPVHSAILPEVLRWHRGERQLSGRETANAYSKVFTHRKKQLGYASYSNVFHSLRDTFITLAMREGIDELQVAWMVGHTEGKGKTMSGRLYFKGFKPKQLSEMVEKVPSFTTQIEDDCV